MDERRVEQRVVEYVAIDPTGREMLVPHITEELAAKWVAEDGVHIVTRERRQLVPVFGVLQTLVPEQTEPARCNKPYVHYVAHTSMNQHCSLAEGHDGKCGSDPERKRCGRLYPTRGGAAARQCGFAPGHSGKCGHGPGLVT